MQFVAIDFETANETRRSACSCGIAVVENGEVIKTKHWLIQPKEMRFKPFNVALHGINEEVVKDQPRLCDIWDEIRPYLENRIVLAHNASFDMSVLRHALNDYELEPPEFDYSCTYLMAKRTWTNWPCYRLSNIAHKLNLEFEHHDAMEDARACATVALAAAETLYAKTFEELEEASSIYRGTLNKNGYQPPYHPREPGLHRAGQSRKPDFRSMEPKADDIDENNPFFQKLVLFTGRLGCLVREEAGQIVVDHGGRCTNSFGKKVNFLVVGEVDPRTLAVGNTKTSKLSKAEALAAEGHEIEIISEDDFLRMLSE